MPKNDPSWLEQRITWDFHVADRHNRVRYGQFNNVYYKQFLPGGIVLSPLHQPRKIPKRLYERAKDKRVE